MNLSTESFQATELLKGKTISVIKKLRKKEILIEFTDGTRLFVDWKQNELEFSITSKIEETLNKKWNK